MVEHDFQKLNVPCGHYFCHPTTSRGTFVARFILSTKSMQRIISLIRFEHAIILTDKPITFTGISEVEISHRTPAKKKKDWIL